jgi:exocyst complex protein 7
MNKSRTNTHSMLGILNSFENRLQKLESTIEPVYNETEMLRRRQESILYRLLCCRDCHGHERIYVW